MPTSWPDLNASDPYGSLGSASPRNNNSPNVSRRPRRVYVQDQHAGSIVNRNRMRKRHRFGSKRARPRNNNMVYVQDQHVGSIVKRMRKRPPGSKRNRLLAMHHSVKHVRGRTSRPVRRLQTPFADKRRTVSSRKSTTDESA